MAQQQSGCRSGDGIAALQRNPVTATPDADITMQGAPLRIFKIFKALWSRCQPFWK